MSVALGVDRCCSCGLVLGGTCRFFGDFFLPNNQGGEYIQKGIYRFLSNPEAVLGNLWMCVSCSTMWMCLGPVPFPMSAP